MIVKKILRSFSPREMQDQPNIPQSEFIVIHAAIDRIFVLQEEGKIAIYPSQMKKLKDIRQKPTYLTHAQKNLTLSLIDSIFINHRNLYDIMTPKQKKMKAPKPELNALFNRIRIIHSEILDNLKQLIPLPIQSV
ncbi:hypothetical protein [Leptospira adleri]|uniref:Uncharacterized protein n=1 Tax=Leptospira adleri TaxID=2023186 RepID=A0ABX4NYJ6_9LEPT|nr:hypothetical protein [Leptospira adleri]PJZ61931.1 hypothetical protein CH376_11055 [Leptospira adleri]